MVHPPSSPWPGARSGSCWRCCEVRSRSWWLPVGRTSGRCRSSEWRYLFLVGGQAGARRGPSGRERQPQGLEGSRVGAHLGRHGLRQFRSRL